MYSFNDQLFKYLLTSDINFRNLYLNKFYYFICFNHIVYFLLSYLILTRIVLKNLINKSNTRIYLHHHHRHQIRHYYQNRLCHHLFQIQHLVYDHNLFHHYLHYIHHHPHRFLYLHRLRHLPQ